MPLLMCDLDDTLVERPPLMRAWAERFLAERGRPELLDWVLAEDHGGHRPRDEFVASVAARTGYDVPLEQFRAEHDEGVNGSYRLVPDVRGALDAARAHGFLVAVITNGPTVQQTRKVRATGLDVLADAVCVSQEVGADKPDPLMFTTAAERAGTTLEGAWVIGDNLDADIAGGAGVGARTVWIKRPEQWIDYHLGAEPDVVVESFPAAVRAVLDATTRQAPASG